MTGKPAKRARTRSPRTAITLSGAATSARTSPRGVVTDTLSSTVAPIGAAGSTGEETKSPDRAPATSNVAGASDASVSRAISLSSARLHDYREEEIPVMYSGESDSQSNSKSTAKASSPAKAAVTSSVRPSRSGKAPRSQLHREMFGDSDSSDSDVIS